MFNKIHVRFKCLKFYEKQSSSLIHDDELNVQRYTKVGILDRN